MKAGNYDIVERLSRGFPGLPIWRSRIALGRAEFIPSSNSCAPSSNFFETFGARFGRDLWRKPRYPAGKWGWADRQTATRFGRKHSAGHHLREISRRLDPSTCSIDSRQACSGQAGSRQAEARMRCMLTTDFTDATDKNDAFDPLPFLHCLPSGLPSAPRLSASPLRREESIRIEDRGEFRVLSYGLIAS